MREVFLRASVRMCKPTCAQAGMRARALARTHATQVGNRTRVIRVTSGKTNHCTIAGLSEIRTARNEVLVIGAWGVAVRPGAMLWHVMSVRAYVCQCARAWMQTYTAHAGRPARARISHAMCVPMQAHVCISAGRQRCAQLRRCARVHMCARLRSVATLSM